MPAFIAQLTGHNLKHPDVEKHEMRGISGVPVICYRHTFIIRIASVGFKQKVWESKPILIDCADHSNVIPLFGYKDVLKNLSMSFNYKSDGFIITL